MVIFFSWQVCPNGLVCFDRPYEGVEDLIPGGGQQLSPNTNCLAGYLSDLTLTGGANILYKSYDYLDENLDSDVDAQDVLAKVRSLIAIQFQTLLSPVFIFKATWVQVPHALGPNSEVCD